jgi:hypothetical protein
VAVSAAVTAGSVVDDDDEDRKPPSMWRALCQAARRTGSVRTALGTTTRVRMPEFSRE